MKREEWTPPWEKHETEIDAEKAADFIYSLLRQNHDLAEERAEAQRAEVQAQAALKSEKDKVIAFEEKDLTEVERLRKQLERLQADPPKTSTETPKVSDADRLRVALRKGLTEEDADRIKGDSLEALEADAVTLKARLDGGKTPPEGQEGPAGDPDYFGGEGAGFSTGGMPSMTPQRVRSDLGGRSGERGEQDPGKAAAELIPR